MKNRRDIFGGPLWELKGQSWRTVRIIESAGCEARLSVLVQTGERKIMVERSYKLPLQASRVSFNLDEHYVKSELSILDRSDRLIAWVFLCRSSTSTALKRPDHASSLTATERNYTLTQRVNTFSTVLYIQPV